MTLQSRLILAGLGCWALVSGAERQGEPARVSEFGRYRGYSEARFSEWVDTSLYVEMRDGVRLAVDVSRPAVDGVPTDERLPVVWTHSRYHRNPGGRAPRSASSGSDRPAIDSRVDVDRALQRLVRHGYVVAAVQVRGGGASFGAYRGLFSEEETSDAAEIIDWLATQPWSNGRVGMYGASYLGMTQYMAASRNPPALRAIFPAVAGFDMYDVVYPGGVFRDDMMRQWGDLTRRLDVEWDPLPVAGDDGTLLREARAEHAKNWDVVREYGSGRFRDHDGADMDWRAHGVSGVLDALNEARVPAYHWGGWYDIFVLDTLLLYANYAGPQKMAIGAWSHAGMSDERLVAERRELLSVEQHRWFDYWLKGIDNGVLDESPIHYAVEAGQGDWHWDSADGWPLAEARNTVYYFEAGPDGGRASGGDGRLVASPPSAEQAYDAWTVDSAATTGSASRWDNAVGAAEVMAYADMTVNDGKSLTYTTPELEADVVITGHPIATLFVTSSTGDADFLVLLEEVEASGFSRYVTEGVLRASHRMLATAPWNNLGLPFQRSFAADVRPLPEGLAGELKMDLHPISTVFDRGHRIRVRIMGADADNIERPEATPTIRLYRDSARPSRIELPVIP